MSALPDLPGHFVASCAASGRPVDTDTFAPRRRYGEYLEATLGGVARHRRPLRRIHARAVGLRVDVAGIEVASRGGVPLATRRVVLAMGYAPPSHLTFVCPGTAASQRYVADPWRPGSLAGAPVLLVGAGLTAVDVALSLARRGHVAPMVAVSRHGLLPAAHVPTPAAPPRWSAPTWATCRSVRPLLADLRHGRVRSYRFAAVVNCTGPGALVATRDPLVRSLLDQGLARREPLGLGFDVDSRGALVGADGTVRPGLTAIGPVRRGRHWEATAIPEIRAQANALAAA